MNTIKSIGISSYSRNTAFKGTPVPSQQNATITENQTTDKNKNAETKWVKPAVVTGILVTGGLIAYKMIKGKSNGIKEAENLEKAVTKEESLKSFQNTVKGIFKTKSQELQKADNERISLENKAFETMSKPALDAKHDAKQKELEQTFDYIAKQNSDNTRIALEYKNFKRSQNIKNKTAYLKNQAYYNSIFKLAEIKDKIANSQIGKFVQNIFNKNKQI